MPSGRRIDLKVLWMFVAFGPSRTPKNACIGGNSDDTVYNIAINPEHLEFKLLGYD